MSHLPPTDEALIGLMLHGQTAELDRMLKPEWMLSEPGRAAAVAAIELAREGKAVNPISVLARAKLGSQYAPDLMRLYKNGFGQADPKDAVEHAFQEYVLRELGAAQEEMRLLAQSKPRDVRRWLPEILSRFGEVMRSGDTYDPRPSTHSKKDLPSIFAQSLITGQGPANSMNAILGGGYRRGYLKLYAGVTKHGKSVTLTSHAVDLLMQKFRVVVIRTENTEQAATHEIACALTGVSYLTEIMVEPRTFKANEWETASEREARYNQCIQWLDEYLRVYDYSYCNDEQLKRLAKWNPPDAVIIDYLKPQPGLFARKSTMSQDVVGDFADWLLVYAHDNGIWLGTAGQISDAMSKKLVKHDSGEPVIIYGSARPGFAADQLTFLKRDHAPNTAYFRVQLRRYGGETLDTIHRIPLSPVRRILMIPQLEQGAA